MNDVESVLPLQLRSGSKHLGQVDQGRDNPGTLAVAERMPFDPGPLALSRHDPAPGAASIALLTADDRYGITARCKALQVGQHLRLAERVGQPII